MTVKLTTKQKLVLGRLARNDAKGYAPATAIEIGEAMGAKLREWARDPLYALRKKGLAEAAGSGSRGQCWVITPAGRALLSPEAPVSMKEE
jgi:hypothetical protein